MSNTKEKVLWKFIRDFSKQTSIHGVLFFGAPKLHFFERYLIGNGNSYTRIKYLTMIIFTCRIFWVIIVTAAAIGAIALSLSNWRRYSANPTVVSLKKDFRNWNNVFPSATACFIERVNENHASKYIYE